ncbi:adenosylmethionine decarboxylase [Coprinopsis marcescibilis]|uniref:S-adenosylmethionine decarboxylase proenzyme n=1 Tax=Coprinopsis marcescibilis TaxID=230819 RepID=A0A5C3KT10_COPMA|nr:adenosylmethionine decarboxylase [Coprinopsis marcescibilis]
MPDPFEGPEKLLEIWFAQSPSDVDKSLRDVPRSVWEEMLDIVRCKVLNVIVGEETDAYLLSESSLFVAPHKLVLKTCGTTLNLYGLPRILEIAEKHAGFKSVYRCFYSRKSFMFPDLQQGPHKDWKQEVEYLDKIFTNGAAYTIGKMNGDHWLLYLTDPDIQTNDVPHSPLERKVTLNHLDYTIEILMSGLSTPARQHFFFPESANPDDPKISTSHAIDLGQRIGISEIFPAHLTTIDAYSFIPCGYSANALIKWGEESLNSDCDSTHRHSGEGYYTIHVTPEEGWSYASFECNVPLSVGQSAETKIPNLTSLIKRVVHIFQPSRLTLTLFISSDENESSQCGETAIETAQRAFKLALADIPESSFGYPLDGSSRSYKRTDKINYEVGGYDLAFASFELK